jgi:hypothetical protein
LEPQEEVRYVEAETLERDLSAMLEIVEFRVSVLVGSGIVFTVDDN